MRDLSRRKKCEGRFESGAVLEEFNHAKDALAADGDVYCTIPQPLGSREVRLLLHLLRRPDTVKYLRARFEALREILD